MSDEHEEQARSNVAHIASAITTIAFWALIVFGMVSCHAIDNGWFGR